VQELNRLSYYRDIFRGRRLRRAYAQFGFRYGPTGRRLEPAEPFPSFLGRLAERARPFSLPDEPVNQCIVARYEAGAGIGWHTDADSFGNCVVGVSIGGSAKFQFRPNGREQVEIEMILRAGSLYSMRGPARWDYQRRISSVKATRFALTMRHVQEREGGSLQ
jgi:alkylated DNA repair dioxygenase AlkB